MREVDPFEVVPVVHEGLGNSAYLVGVGEGSAIAVDPNRRSEALRATAEDRGWTIEGVLETHLHADFVTGALDLREATGATLWRPAGDGVAFAHREARDGDRLELGACEVEVRATPSHTPEHAMYVLRRAGAAPPLAFTGGVVIVGGAARTDLIAPERTDELTRALYRSRRAFDDLPDETVLLPTHGAGSFCSTGSADRRTATLGEERASNPILGFRGDEDAFAAWFPTTFPATPTYYARMRAVNAAGPTPAGEVPGPPPLDPRSALAASAGGALLVDVRRPDVYAEAHIPGSLEIAFRDRFCLWLGWLAPGDASLVFVVDDQPIEDVVGEAMLVGFERFAGVLDRGLEAWREEGLPVMSTPDLDGAEADERAASGALVLDVREPSEVAAGTMPGAVPIPLGELAGRAAAELPKNAPIVAYCAAGERSVSAVSILEREGFTDVSNLRSGYDAWVARR